MSKITWSTIKPISIFLLLSGLLFITLLLMQNKTIMSIDMTTSTGKSLNPELFYTDMSQTYSQIKSLLPYSKKNNQYLFDLTNIQNIKYIRLDPSRRKNTITISKISIIASKWFTKYIGQLNIADLKAINQIDILKQNNTKLNFITLGNDPQLEMKFVTKQISSSTLTHIALLFSSILLVSVLFFIYYTYKNEEHKEKMKIKILLYSLFLFFALFKVIYYKDNIKFGYPPDEIMHLAYIDHLHKHQELIPEFENMSMFGKDNTYNYLNHPSLYYHIMNLAYNDNYSIRDNTDNFRTLSVVIFMASFLLLLYFGFSSKLDIIAHLVYLTFISSVPMYAYLGSSINNDTLAILGGIIFMLGLKRILEKKYTNLTYMILAIGIFIAYFSKLTAAILIFFASVYVLFYMLKTKHEFRISKNQIIILTIPLVPIIYYQLYIILTYHSLMPSFNITNFEAYLKSGFFIQEDYRQHLTPLEWFGRMKHYIIGGWFNIHSHHSFGDSAIQKYIGLLLLHIIAIVALFYKCDEKQKPYCLVGKIGILAFFSVQIVQYVFSYKAHLNSGYLGGLQPRYLLPFMFSFAIMASIFVDRFSKSFIFTILIILICIQALYSDFFYFLKYYA